MVRHGKCFKTGNNTWMPWVRLMEQRLRLCRMLNQPWFLRHMKHSFGLANCAKNKNKAQQPSFLPLHPCASCVTCE